MEHVNEGSHSFNCHPRLSTAGINHTCHYSPAADRHRTFGRHLFSIYFRPAEGRRLSWPEKVKGAILLTPWSSLFSSHRACRLIYHSLWRNGQTYSYLPSHCSLDSTFPFHWWCEATLAWAAGYILDDIPGNVHPSQY